MPDDKQEARRIIAEVARAIDRRLAVAVREVPGQQRLKRANDTMMFKPMPDHRLASVTPVPPPGGQFGSRGAPRGRGRR